MNCKCKRFNPDGARRARRHFWGRSRVLFWTHRNFSDNSAKAALEYLENVTAEQITHEIGFLVKATLECDEIKNATIKGMCVRVRVFECVFVVGEVVYHTLEASLSQFFSLWTKLELKISRAFFCERHPEKWQKAAAPIRYCFNSLLISGSQRCCWAIHTLLLEVDFFCKTLEL